MKFMYQKTLSHSEAPSHKPIRENKADIDEIRSPDQIIMLELEDEITIIGESPEWQCAAPVAPSSSDGNGCVDLLSGADEEPSSSVKGTKKPTGAPFTFAGKRDGGMVGMTNSSKGPGMTKSSGDSHSDNVDSNSVFLKRGVRFAYNLDEYAVKCAVEAMGLRKDKTAYFKMI